MTTAKVRGAFQGRETGYGVTVIRADRNRVPPPSALADSDVMRDLDERADRYFASTRKADRQRQYDFPDGPLTAPEVINALAGLFDGRCAFCSSPLTGALAPHRFRPPQAAVAADGSVQREHYFWLAYDWHNLYPACGACSAAQGAKFPVVGNRVPFGARGGELSEEHPLLLDPCTDDPEQHLIYLPSGEVVAVEERGRVTIDVFALNRSELVPLRQSIVREARAAYQQIVRTFQREEYERCALLLEAAYAPDRPFAATYRQHVNQRVQTRHRQLGSMMVATGRDLADLVGTLPTVTGRMLDEAASRFLGGPVAYQEVTPRYVEVRPRQYKLPELGRIRAIEDEVGTRSFAIRHVRIRNFKGLRDVRLNLDGRPGLGGWTVLLGENGVGKTSILQAIAMALAGPDGIGRTGLKPRDVLRQRTDEGSVLVELDGLNLELSVKFGRGGRFEFNTDLSIPLAGYGATRLLANPTAKKPRYVTANIENLFDPFVALASTELWVPDLSETEFSAIAGALIRLLGVVDEAAYLQRSHSGSLFLAGANGRIPLSQLSSGYQATAAMALDLMRVFLNRWGNLEAAEGIVLIDEIDAHLHPRWQMRVVDSLRSAFPRVQFVASSHSPLTLRGLLDGEAVVIEQTTEGVVVQQDLPPLAGMTVDQLLTSETFGLHSTIDPDLERDFERYYQLLAEYDHGPAVADEISALRDRLDLRRQLGDTRRERIMLQAIDDYLARERELDTNARRGGSIELRARLAALWAQDEP